jgi:hypothetical protein
MSGETTLHIDQQQQGAVRPDGGVHEAEPH